MNVKMEMIHRKKPAYSPEVLEDRKYGYQKDNLKNDFHGSCGYCGSPDHIFGGRSGFQIDHFAPQSKFPELTNVYTNLVYSCPICNRGKSSKWPSDNPVQSIKGEEGFIHPCSKDYNEHLYRNEDGSIASNSAVGNYMIQELKLYLLRHQVIWVREELRELILEVKKKVNQSSELGAKYSELTAAFFEYDEILRASIDQR